MNYAEFALIRFGAGLSPRFTGPSNADALMASLHEDDALRGQFPVQATAETVVLLGKYSAARRGRKADPQAEADYTKYRDELVRLVGNAQRARAARAVDAATGFADRLAQFWSSHFSMRATGAHARIMIESFLEDVIRAHQLGRFADLLKAATTHQAMLTYLDQTSSVGPGSRLASRRSKPMGLNENHARELLELHTLGVGDAYSQQDVRQLAELMTGLIVAKDHDFKYDINRAEPGTETVLGKEYGGATPPELAEVEAFLDDLAIHPGTARFISTKLARHFCADIPPADLVEAMTRRFSDTDGDLMAVYEVMVSHPAAQDSFGQKVRQPWDLVIAGFRALGMRGDDIMTMKLGKLRRIFIQPLGQMGQGLAGAPQPEGWPEEAEAWLGPQQLAARIDWALNMPPVMLKELPQIDRFVGIALDDAGAQAVGPIVSRAESRAEGVGLVLASPQFNRR